MEHISASRTYPAPTAVVWDVITDPDVYASVAPNLTDVAIVEGAGDGMVRRCADVNGYVWHETVVHWEPERAFRVVVDVPGSRFHRRLFTRFEGTWELTPLIADVRVRITFAFEPRYGPLGRLTAWYVRRTAPDILETIFEGWDAELSERQGAVTDDRRTRETTSMPASGGGRTSPTS